MKATICLLKFCLSKFVTCSIRQVLSDFSTIKVLRYMVADGRGLSNTVSWVTVKGEQGNVSFAIHFTVTSCTLLTRWSDSVLKVGMWYIL